MFRHEDRHGSIEINWTRGYRFTGIYAVAWCVFLGAATYAFGQAIITGRGPQIVLGLFGLAAVFGALATMKLSKDD